MDGEDNMAVPRPWHFVVWKPTVDEALANLTDLVAELVEGGESVFFLEDEADPVIANYKVMDNPAQLVVEAFVTQSTIADTQLVQTWITDVGLPGVSFIPDGVWQFHINAYKTGGTKEVRLYNEIYKRNLAGTETLLGTTDNSIPLTAVEAVLPTYNIYISAQTLLDTDRIVTKTRMRLVGGGSNPTSVTIGYSGTTAARLAIPSQAADLNRLVNTTNAQTIGGAKTFSSPVGLPTYTVAALPAGSAGWMAFATNGRKNGEGVGSGTGVMVFHDGAAWRACDTGATVAA